MIGARTNPFGSSPWPMDFGNPGNTSVASVAASMAGQTLWSVPISSEWGYEIVVGEDGCVFVASSDCLLAVEPDGGIRWRHRLGGGFGAPTAFADGSIVLAEDVGRRLVARDQATGDERWSVSGEGWSLRRPTATSDGNVIQQRGSSVGSGTELCCLSFEGNPRWSYQLSRSGGEALALNGLVLIADGSYLTGLNNEGQFLWLANRQLFIFGDSSRDVERVIKSEHFWTPPMRLDESQIVAGCKWHDGHGILILDLAKRTVAFCGGTASMALPFRQPLVVTPGPQPHLVGAFGTALMAFDVYGRLIFERAAPQEINNILSDSIGNLIVSEGVAPDYWKKYKDAYNLHDSCGLLAFNAAGEQVFRWIAPGPMAGALAVGKAGEIYCVSEGKLWAVG